MPFLHWTLDCMLYNLMRKYNMRSMFESNMFRIMDYVIHYVMDYIMDYIMHYVMDYIMDYIMHYVMAYIMDYIMHYVMAYIMV